jgi:hypothetical protein
MSPERPGEPSRVKTRRENILKQKALLAKLDQLNEEDIADTVKRKKIVRLPSLVILSS